MCKTVAPIMLIYFNNIELSTTPIFSTTLKDWGILCEYVKSDRGVYLFESL